MHQYERNRAILSRYIPEAAASLLAEWVHSFDFKLKIKRSRKSKYGDYRQPIAGKNHQITINHDLNPYAFLLTLIHEVAHLVTFEKHGNTVKPHGEEWKQAFKELMHPIMRLNVFPEDVRQSIVSYMQNPAATSCADLHLMRVLREYDTEKSKVIHLEELPLDALFIHNGREFRKGIKRRTRFLCLETATRRQYLFSPLAEVESDAIINQTISPPVPHPPVRAVAHTIPQLRPVQEMPSIPSPAVTQKQYKLMEVRVALAALAHGELFGFNSIIYRKGEQQHAYFLCTALDSQQITRFSPVILVNRIEEIQQA
jgi:predicted SprT family Zn-dependent metalloprotease